MRPYRTFPNKSVGYRTNKYTPSVHCKVPYLPNRPLEPRVGICIPSVLQKEHTYSYIPGIEKNAWYILPPSKKAVAVLGCYIRTGSLELLPPTGPVRELTADLRILRSTCITGVYQIQRTPVRHVFPRIYIPDVLGLLWSHHWRRLPISSFWRGHALLALFAAASLKS